MASNRIGRINEEIQRELAELIRSLKDPRVQTMISITRVDTTPDLRYSKIYVSVLEEARSQDALRGLKSAGGWLRRELGSRLQLRYTPELVFTLDDSLKYGAHMFDLLEKIEHMRAVFERIVEREDKLRRIAQLQTAAKLAPQPSARGLQAAQRVLRPGLFQHTHINFTVAQIGRGVHARDGDHGLHPRVLQRADQLRQLPLDLLVDPANSVGSHSTSL